MKILFEFTFKSIFQAKLLNLLRKSVVKYAVASLMIGFAIPLIQTADQALFHWKVFFLFFVTTIALSIFAIITSSYIISKKLSKEGKHRLNLIFLEDGIEIEGVTDKKKNGLGSLIIEFIPTFSILE